MKNCSIQNKNTKEPKIFYKSDKGNIYSSIQDVLNNSSDSYETGVMNQAQDFVKMIETPIFDRSTQKGQIQSYIRNGYLTGRQVAPNTYEAQDSYAAEILHTELLITQPYNTFKRSGNNFEFGDFTPKVSKESGLLEVMDTLNDFVSKKFSKKNPKPINYNQDELKIMIENFMKKMGFSITSIENYKKNYQTKYGVEPNAEALIDFNSKILAFKNGEITLDNLSEEFSHFVIESWDQSEIQRMLSYVQNTQEYIQNAERYREAYSRQTQDKTKIEEAVRREVLGKMLANSLQKDFNLDTRTSNEQNIFRRLSEILRDFMNNLISKFTPNLESDLNKMVQEIKNGLYNENLDKQLNSNNTPIINVMYSLSNSEKNNIINAVKELNIGDTIGDDVNVSQVLKDLDKLINTVYSSTLAANMALKNTTDMIDLSLNGVVEDVLSQETFLTYLREMFRQGNYTGRTDSETLTKFRNNFIAKASKTLDEISNLKGLYETKKEVEVESVLQTQYEKYTNISQEGIEEIVRTSEKQQEDTNGFIARFGHTAKTSNSFVTLLSTIIGTLNQTSLSNFVNDANRFLLPLEKFKNKLKNFINKNGIIRSGVDSFKRQQDQRNYELKILGQVYPKYASMSLEDYIKEYDENGILPIENKNTDDYFRYRYLYDKGLENEKWESKRVKERKSKFIEMLNSMELGEEPWMNSWYQDVIFKSDNRGEVNLSDEREKANPYNNDGTLKDGIIALYYKDAKNKVKSGVLKKSNVASINSTQKLFEGDNQPSDKDLVYIYDSFSKTNPKTKKSSGRIEGELVFFTMKWNAVRSGSTSPDIKNTIKQNFKNEYDKKIKQLKSLNLKDSEFKKELKTWLESNISFQPSEAYWESFNNSAKSEIRFNDLYDAIKLQKEKLEVETLEFSYKNLTNQKKLILKKYKNQNDYKEMDVDKMSYSEKIKIFDIDNQLEDIRKQLYQKFELYNLGDLYTASKLDSESVLNTSFNELFEQVVGKTFDDPTLITVSNTGKISAREMESFFSNAENFDGNKLINYRKLKKDLENGNSSYLVGRYTDSTSNRGLETTPENILRTFFIDNSPAWFKRYDSNKNYDNFLKDYNSGKVDVEEMMNNYFKNDGQILYSSEQNKAPVIIDMEISPSFKYSVTPPTDIKAIYEEYKKLDNNSPKNIKSKFDMIQEMGDIGDIDSVYKEDISDIVNNSENLKQYIQMMDLVLHRLELDQNLKKNYLFLMPQVRKTNLERIATFIKNGKKVAQFKDYLKETFLFREDDYENSYKSMKIPKYGYYKLKPEELTQDIFYALASGLNSAVQYNQKKIHESDAMTALRGLESQDFKNGKKATDTNYHKMMRKMIDFNFYGKTASSKVEFDLPGVGKIDLSKFLFALKGLGTTAALAFSPIVAATNFLSGVVQNSIMTATGRNIYSPSNKRALGVLGQVLPSSFKDIGGFGPEAKINKIMYSFGVYNFVERFQDSQYNRAWRIIPELGFGMMGLTNFPLQAQSVLTKLMEYRLIDGKFISWRDFSIQQKTKNPDMTYEAIKTAFESAKGKSMYDYMQDDGDFNIDKLQNDGYKGDIAKDKNIVTLDIRNITELTTMEIYKNNEGSAGRDPAWSFVLALKKWLIMATTTMTSRERIDATGAKEEGLLYTPKYLIKLFKTALKDRENLSRDYNSLPEHVRKNLRTSMVIGGVLISLMALTTLLKKTADDDDEEDNYLLQLMAYLSMRSLNEAFSGNIGIGESYFEAIQNPIMVGTTLKNIASIDPSGYNETVKSGKYQGVNKFAASLMKATSLRNPYSVSSSEIIKGTRQSYEHFNTSDNLYSIFSLIPEIDSDEE